MLLLSGFYAESPEDGDDCRGACDERRSDVDRPTVCDVRRDRPTRDSADDEPSTTTTTSSSGGRSSKLAVEGRGLPLLPLVVTVAASLATRRCAAAAVISLGLFFLVVERVDLIRRLPASFVHR